MQAHIVDLELLPLRFLPYGHEVNPESIVLIRTSRPTKRLEPEVENGPVCHIFRFASRGLARMKLKTSKPAPPQRA